MIYTIMAIASAVAIIFRHPLADVAAKTAAPIGAAFCFLALVTGSLWGKPMWGTWWVWDARLTSMFVLFLLYLGYIAVWQTIDDPHRAAAIARIVALVGFVNVPIVKFSVDWWNSLHQPASVLRMDGPSIDPAHAGAIARHGACLYGAVSGSSSHRHAQRDRRPPHSRLETRRDRQALMDLAGAHIAYVVVSYAVTAAALVLLAADDPAARPAAQARIGTPRNGNRR